VKLEGSSDMVEISAERTSKYDVDEHLIETFATEYYVLTNPHTIDDAGARASSLTGVLESICRRLDSDKKLSLLSIWLVAEADDASIGWSHLVLSGGNSHHRRHMKY